MNFVRDLLPNDNLSPVELSKFKSEFKNNFLGVFNILYILLQYILYPHYISWLSSGKNQIDGFKIMLEVFLFIVGFYCIFRIIFYLVLG